MADDKKYKTVQGEAFNVKQSDKIDARTFAVRRDHDGMIANGTLWDNSHGHVELKDGDGVRINGKYTRAPKQNGDGFWHNISVSRIGVIPMDSGVRNENEGGSDDENEASGDEPDVL
jgi:hypothetical protein